METIAFLDTHLFVWLAAGEARLISPAAQKIIDKAILFTSPMTLLEIDYLYETDKVTEKGETMWRKLYDVIPVEIADDSFVKICGVASQIAWTRDPFDRLIVAHAQLRKAPLVTKDKTIRRHYRCVW